MSITSKFLIIEKLLNRGIIKTLIFKAIDNISPGDITHIGIKVTHNAEDVTHG